MPANVHVYNDIDNQILQALYRNHHLFVMPSLVEGFGLVYQEALAEGLPILCTENTGGADIVTDGVEGFIVPAGDADIIATRIDACLRSRSLLPSMSKAARERSAQWTWERFRSEIRKAIHAFELAKFEKSRP